MLSLGSAFDTALDSQGVLHAAFYNTRTHDVMYATRDTAGLWSAAQIVDNRGDVGHGTRRIERGLRHPCGGGDR